MKWARSTLTIWFGFEKYLFCRCYANDDYDHRQWRSEASTLIQIDFIHSEFYLIFFFGRQQNVKVNCYCVSGEAHAWWVMYKVTYSETHRYSFHMPSECIRLKILFFFFFHSNSFYFAHAIRLLRLCRFMCVMIPTMCILLCTLHVIRHSSTKPQQSVPSTYILRCASFFFWRLFSLKLALVWINFNGDNI